MKERSTLAGWLMAGLLVAVSPAQERRSHPGRALDERGAPIAGADVLLVHAPRFCAELGGGDVQQVVSDEQGRFVASLRKDGCYWAFLHGAEAVPVVPGFETVLQLQEKRLILKGPDAQRLRVRGLDAWGRLAPTDVRFGVGTLGWVTRWEQLQAERVARPPLPGRNTRLLFRDSQGQLAAVIEQSFAAPTVSYPPPAAVIVAVVDADGQPVEGALVQRWIGWRERSLGRWPTSRNAGVWVECGRTNMEGELGCVMPLQRRSRLRNPFVFLVRTEDAVGIGEWRMPPMVRGEQAALSRVPVKLGPGIRIEGTVEGLAETAQARLLARLEEPRPAHDRGLGPGSYRFDVVLERSGAETFRSGLWPKTTTVACAFLKTHVPVPDGLTSGPVDRAAIWIPGEDWQEIGFDLGRVRMVPLEVVQPDGSPCSRFELNAVPVFDGRVPCNDWLPVSSGDPAGRIVLPLHEGDWLVQVASDAGVAWQMVEVSPKPNPKPIQVRLRAATERAVTVVDVDGKPVPHAYVEGRAPFVRWRQEPIAYAIDQRIREWNQAQLPRSACDENGRCVVRFLAPVSGSFQLHARLGDREGKIELVGSKPAVEVPIY